MTELAQTAVAQYRRQLYLLGASCLILLIGSVLIGSTALASLGFPCSQAIEYSVVAFTLGGGSLNVTGNGRAVAILLSLAGVLFISLVISIVTLTVEMKAGLEAARAVFKEELQRLEEELRKSGR